MYIKKLRMARGLTQQQLADITGIDRAAIARYESGDRTPPISKMKIIAEALNVSLDALAGYDSYSQAAGDSSAFTEEFTETLYRRPQMRILFDAAKDAPDDVLQKTADLLEAMKNGRQKQ